MRYVITAFNMTCLASVATPAREELSNIVTDLREGRLQGSSAWMSDGENALQFVTPWLGAYNPDEDWAMDAKLEGVIRQRLYAIDASVRVCSWEYLHKKP